MTMFNLSDGVLFIPKQLQRGICPRFNYSNGSWHCGFEHVWTNAAGMGVIMDYPWQLPEITGKLGSYSSYRML